MTFFTRNRGSKQLRARQGNGRFVRATMDAKICECGAILLPRYTDEPFPVLKYPESCHLCGKAVP